MKNRMIDVSLNGGGKPRKLKGPGLKFNVNNVRNVSPEVSLCLKHLPEYQGSFLLPALGNNPLLPACIASLNSSSKVTIHQIDSHDDAAVKESLKNYKSIDYQLSPDPESTEYRIMAIFCISINSDRLLNLDLLERLNNILPDDSQVLISMAKKRYKDLVKKLTKVFKGCQVMDRSRDAVIFKARTSLEKDKWSLREKTVEVDAIGASMQMTTRPGVFAHGRVDSGGLALYETLELNQDESMLELGCGAGLVGLLGAERARKREGDYKGRMLLVDSCSRAVACTKKNIESSGFKKIEAILDHNFETNDTFDVVAGNPPYYANHRIAEYFIKTASSVLGEGGRLYLVSKHGDLMEDLASAANFHCETVSRRGYDVLIGRKQF